MFLGRFKLVVSWVLFPPAAVYNFLETILCIQSDSPSEKKKDDSSDRLEQLQYENDRLKVALTQR